MDDKSFNIRVPKKWARVALIVTVTALVVAPLTAIASHSFTDVADSNTFHADIAWLADAEVTKGCNPPANTLYCPGDNVTRGQMAAFMRRFAQYIDAEDGTPAVANLAETVKNGAVGTNQIALNAQGVAVAGVQFRAAGTLVNYFNRAGGAPTVTNTAAGSYEIAFPGLEGQLGPSAIIVATDAENPPHIVRHYVAGSDDVVTLRVYDVTGALSNSDINLVVMATNSTAVAGASAMTREDGAE